MCVCVCVCVFVRVFVDMCEVFFKRCLFSVLSVASVRGVHTFRMNTFVTCVYVHTCVCSCGYVSASVYEHERV